MADVNYVASVITIVTSVGFGAVVKSIIDGIIAHRNGVSGREDKRRSDIIAQREHALKLASDAEAGEAVERQLRKEAEVRADAERARRRRVVEELARARLTMIGAGIDPGASYLDELENTDVPTSK
ncbi:MAG: hypothetical protein K0S37_751 [Microbacterium sp.]|jgi:hypothetical protein|nr:hypothetical protein [Microbacterium sp.]